MILCFVWSSRFVVLHGFAAKERRFVSTSHNDIHSLEPISRQSGQIVENQPQNRGQFLLSVARTTCLLSSTTLSTLSLRHFPPSYASSLTEDAVHHPFRYSNDWTGTNLQVLNISAALSSAIPMEKSRNGSILKYRWPMGRWPDPILRKSADPVDSSLFGSYVLRQTCDLLRNTAVAEGAVGLAAQQCGVNARIIYLEVPLYQEKSHIMLINPRIVRRSPERDMKVWRENCLVLPPTFQATVIRDAWVDVEYQDWTGKILPSVKRLYGERARALQHEMDHDRGILVTDHVSLDELENDVMRLIERPGHDHRMYIAYDRYIQNSYKFPSVS